MGQAFEELVLRILETPSLLDPGASLGVKLGGGQAQGPPAACSC